jgi:uncharacterized membrane protein (DUF4010 family)
MENLQSCCHRSHHGRATGMEATNYRIATRLSDIDLRSAVLLAILSFIVYPVLPARPVDLHGLVQLQETWATVLLERAHRKL